MYICFGFRCFVTSLNSCHDLEIIDVIQYRQANIKQKIILQINNVNWTMGTWYLQSNEGDVSWKLFFTCKQYITNENASNFHIIEVPRNIGIYKF